MRKMAAQQLAVCSRVAARSMASAHFHIFTWVLLLISTTADSQSPGTLRLFIDPGNNFSFVLDGKHRMQQREVTLPGGPHRFQFWAPTRRIVDTTLAVFPDRTVDFTLRLPFSDEYKAYQFQMKAFRNNRKVNRLVPLLATGASAVVSTVLFIKYSDAHKQLEEDVALYDALTTPGAIRVLKEQDMVAHVDDFKKAETRFAISAGVTGGLAILTGYLFVKSARVKVPVFDDKERVKFDGLAWMPGSKGGTWGGGFTINMAKR
ncbi:MAG: hypothetical protein ABI599_11935 [Flavobacteriales bacterium]